MAANKTAKEGKWASTSPKTNPKGNPLGNAQSWCYLCSSGHRRVEPCLR